MPDDRAAQGARQDSRAIAVGISNRHVHLSPADRDALFGNGYRLRALRDLSQRGQYAARETVTLIGPRGCLEGVRVLGPERERTQVEISRGDMYHLGVHAPVRDSGDLAGTPGIILIGPNGVLSTRQGLICARRHIHMHPDDARRFGVSDGQRVHVRAAGERAVVFEETLVRVHESFTLELHLDTDEANAAGLVNNDPVYLL